MPARRPVTNVVRTIPPKRAIEILTALIKDATGLEGEPFGSPKRDQWTITAQGALERTFGSDSSIVASFGSAQAIAFTSGDSDENLRKAVNQMLASEISVIQSAIQQLSWATEDVEDTAILPAANIAPSAIMVFVSHSSRDEALAKALIDLLRPALGLPPNQIRCSSVDGYRLPVGVNTESKLREEVNAAKVVIGLITPSSLASHFVMFELGARWGAGLFVAPLLAGVAPDELRGPLGLLNALSADTQSRLIQLVEDVAKQLGVNPQSAASYMGEIDAVRQAANAIPKAGQAQIGTSDEPTIAALKQENSSLAADNAQLREKLLIKGAIRRINGHTYVDGDDAEMCSRCLAVLSLAVPLQDMNLDGKGMKATCPQCKMPRGKWPPISRKQAEENARKNAEKLPTC
jgi:hypothetical protein